MLAFRRSRRQDGTQFLEAIIAEDITLPAGSRLLLARLHGGENLGPEYALRVIPPTAPLTTSERREANASRLDGSAIRHDPRLPPEPAPFGAGAGAGQQPEAQP